MAGRGGFFIKCTHSHLTDIFTFSKQAEKLNSPNVCKVEKDALY